MIYKSKIYSDADLKRAFNTPITEDVNLKTLEIAFDRTCNFACSYCNPAFSTTWAKDIKQNGPYTNLISDGRNHFTHSHDSAQLYKLEETNPYVEAFFNRGLCKEMQKDIAGALQDYEQALLLNPDFKLAIDGKKRLRK